MKTSIISNAAQGGARRIPQGLVLAAAVLLHQGAAAGPAEVDLGSASKFAVLAGAGITVAGAVNTTKITGDIGSFPTLSITGLGNVVLNGVNQGGNSITQQAQLDLTAAFTDASTRLPTMSFSPIADLGGMTLTSGVYFDPSSFGITGTLNLDAKGDANAVWIFQAGSTLTTASDSSVVLMNGAQACNVFWEVGSSATLGSGTDFSGSILASSSITLVTGATMDGSALAETGAVTLDTNSITMATCTDDSNGGGGGGGGNPVPDTANTFLLLASGLAAVTAFGRRPPPFI